MLTKRHFEVFAKLIGTSGAYQHMQNSGFINSLCQYFNRENDRFDSIRFKLAIEKWRSIALAEREIV